MENLTINNLNTASDLPINLGSELLIEIVNLKQRIKSVLVGMEDGQYIITKLSHKDLMGNFRSDTVKESAMVVSYLHRGTVYGFNVEVINVVSNPAKLFFITYPKKVEALSVRSDMRYRCMLPAEAMLGNEIMEMVILDISKEGCQCVVNVTNPRNTSIFGLIQVNKIMHMRVQFPGVEGGVDIAGRVRNNSKDVDKINLGVVFEGMAPEVKVKLSNYLTMVSEFGPEN